MLVLHLAVVTPSHFLTAIATNSLTLDAAKHQVPHLRIVPIRNGTISILHNVRAGIGIFQHAVPRFVLETRKAVSGAIDDFPPFERSYRARTPYAAGLW